MTQWTYLWADETARKRLGDTPEQLMNQAVEVKSNPVRTVMRRDAFYFKYDRRKSGRARREWRSFQHLRDAGIPVVNYLACGESAAGTLLITEAWPQSESVAEYFYRRFESGGDDPGPFLKRYADFISAFLHSGFFHPDFHAGNILISRSTGEFALVDVYGVRTMTLFDRLFRRYRQERIGMELRTCLDRKTMLHFLSEYGVADAGVFYERALRREAARLHHEWPRRREQILGGYPKFTRSEGNLLRTVDQVRELLPLEGCEIRREEPLMAENLFLAHFFLQLAAIPHRRVAALDRNAGILWLEPVAAPLPCSEIPEELPERLRVLGCPEEDAAWSADRFGRPLLRDYDRIAGMISK